MCEVSTAVGIGPWTTYSNPLFCAVFDNPLFVHKPVIPIEARCTSPHRGVLGMHAGEGVGGPAASMVGELGSSGSSGSHLMTPSSTHAAPRCIIVQRAEIGGALPVARAARATQPAAGAPPVQVAPPVTSGGQYSSIASVLFAKCGTADACQVAPTSKSLARLRLTVWTPAYGVPRPPPWPPPWSAPAPIWPWARTGPPWSHAGSTGWARL